MTEPSKPVGKATLYVGVLLALLGVVLLFWTQNFIFGMLKWWPIVLTLAGIFALYKVVFKNARPPFLLAGLLMFLSGIFILLLNTLLTPYLSLRQLWPVFMGIIGISLIPYGFQYRRAIRLSLVIPGAFLVCFMVGLLMFTLSVVEITFLQFVLGWWPLLLVFMGVVLIIAYYLRNLDHSPDGSSEHECSTDQDLDD